MTFSEKSIATSAVASCLHSDLSWFVIRAKTPKLRTMRLFAEEEIVIPDGPYQGRRFRCSRQPYTGLWFDAVDSGIWNRYVATGPTQSGKTLACFVIPLVYHLFEVGETVICGLPDMDMASDKWREDILPVIEQSRFKELLPRQGSGSRGGKVETLQFSNGATLKFMSGGGGDKSRAGFTSRVVVITETDGMDQPGQASRESDKITQLEARTRAYGSRKRIYMECTVSTEKGRTWSEYKQGTQSRIVVSCPLCKTWVSPERENLVGWQTADSQQMARLTAVFNCPACQGEWTEEQRTQANAGCRLVHDGQMFGEDGEVHGNAPATDTLGFRWSAVNNLFLTAGDVGADEWRASRAPDEENAEREMRQFVWCLPSLPSKECETSLEAMELAARISTWPKGIVPVDTRQLTAAIDIGKYLCHWIVVAWCEGATGHVVDYGRIEVASSDLGVEGAVGLALRQFRDQMKTGFPVGRPDGPVKHINFAFVDAGYMTEIVYAFIREVSNPFGPAVGRGASQQFKQWYNKPTSCGNVVRHIGHGYHISFMQHDRVHLVEIDADFWKTWIHQRLSEPLGTAGAMTFYQAQPHEHLSLVKHLTAETKTEEFVAGQGVRVKWERLRKQNHWFDALYNAGCAGYLAGARLTDECKPKRERKPLSQFMGGKRPDGRPWIDAEGWKENQERWFGS